MNFFDTIWYCLLLQIFIPAQPVTYEAIVASDYVRTYAIFIYNCINADYMDKPEMIAGVTGINIPGYKLKEFRYSSTPYSIEMRCLNSPASNWFNLVYELSANTNFSLLPGNLYVVHTCTWLFVIVCLCTRLYIHNNASKMDETSYLMYMFVDCFSVSTGNSCIANGYKYSSCCQPLQDPTYSCRVTSSQNCYCDALCLEQGDCCSDVDQLQVFRSCVPSEQRSMTE